MLVRRIGLSLRSRYLSVYDAFQAGEHQESTEADYFLEKGEDPFSRYGSGIVSYFTIMRIALVYLVVVAIAFVPIMLQYYSWSPEHFRTKSETF